jgi:uncharacterized protein YhjY with autotransporter beta-barrel domain
MVAASARNPDWVLPLEPRRGTLLVRRAARLPWFKLALLASISPLALAVHEADATTASDAVATTPENTAVPINLAPDITGTLGYTPVVTVSAGPSHGSATVSGEVVTYTPAAGFTGADTFTYQAVTIFDEVPASAVVTVTVTPPSAPAGAAPTLPPSVYGMVGALESQASLSAFAQLNNFDRHLEDLRDTLRHMKALGISINGQSGSNASLEVASIASLLGPAAPKFASDANRDGLMPQTAQADASAAVPIELPDRIGLFLNGNLSLRQITGTNGVPDASPRTTSVSGGVDYRLNAGTIIGIGGGYTGNTTDIGGGSRSTSDAFNITTYGTTRPIDPVYIDAQASYTHLYFHSARDVSGSTFVYGDPDGNTFSGSVTGGYEFDTGPYTFGPYLRAEGAHSAIQGFTETGSGAAAVAVSAQTVDSVHSVIGFRGDRAISTDYGILSPHLRAEYLHEFIGASGATVAFANGAASGFQVSGYPVSRNYFTLGLGASFLTVSALSVFLDYDALVGYTHQTDHSITGGISIRF